MRSPSMAKTHLALFLILIIFLLAACGQDKTKKTSWPLKIDVPGQILVASLETEIPQLMEQAMIPGLSIALIRDGVPVWSKGFGMKNTETSEPVTDTTIYEACSLSKPVFAYAVMKLVEKGKLELDKPLIEYVTDDYIEKEFLGRPIDDARFRKITTRMVLSHTPGFPNWRNNQPLTIQFEPGEKFSYSGEGFGYLQKVVEKVTELPLNDFMQREVFTPLGMTNSSYVWEDRFDKNTASPHGFIPDAGTKRKPNRAHAAATLHTTAVDFAKFLLAIINSINIEQSTVDTMLTPQVTVAPAETTAVAWGLGVGLQQTPDGISYWHWGDNGDFKCFFIAFPKQKLGFVYFTNSFYGLAIRQQITDLAIGGDHPVLSSSLLSEYGDVESPAMVFTRALVRNGIDSALVKYQELTQKIPARDIMPEYAMNSLGYQLLGKKRIDEAIQIFKLNVSAFSESWNVYDSLGEAFMENGDKELAIQHYEKSLQLNPDNANGAKILKRLREL